MRSSLVKQIARRPQAVAVERGADLPAIGEGDRRRPIPRLHQRGVVFVEGAPLLVHQRIARPGFRNHHHHGVGERVAALHQEFERVVEAGGVRLALVGDRPELVDVLAEQRRGDARLPRRHPVDVAAQRVDLAVVRDVAVRVRQRPGRERVGREALVHERERTLEIRIVQIGIIGLELIGQEHAFVDHRAAGDRHRVIARGAPLAPAIDRIGDRLAQDVEPAFELVFRELLLAAADEHLHVRRLGRLDQFTERGIVGRHVAPADEREPLARDHFGVDVANDLPPIGVGRHEQLADGVFAGCRQLEAEFGRLREEELVRDLHQDAGAVAHARIGTDRAAVLEVAQDPQAVFDDLMRLAALDVGDEADAAGILVELGIVEALGRRHAGIGRGARARGGAQPRRLVEQSCALFALAHLTPFTPSRRSRHGFRRTCRVRRARKGAAVAA